MYISSLCALFAGRNVAAGMTGGLGYFYDEEGDFEDKVNAEIVTVQPVRTAAGEAQLRALLTDHVEKTGAPPAAAAVHAGDSSPSPLLTKNDAFCVCTKTCSQGW
jgi:glutamate synthase domain-containing protein 3